jgi:ParB/RepB/Spo0J family partition protein
VRRARKTIRRATFEDLDAGIDERPPVDDRLVPLAADSLNRTQPAQSTAPREDGIGELAGSLQAHGLLQRVVVRRRGTGYELIAGHRRFEAAKLTGWREIAAVVRDENDNHAYILTLVENLQREDLTPKEEDGRLQVEIASIAVAMGPVAVAQENVPTLTADIVRQTLERTRR